MTSNIIPELVVVTSAGRVALDLHRGSFKLRQPFLRCCLLDRGMDHGLPVFFQHRRILLHGRNRFFERQDHAATGG